MTTRPSSLTNVAQRSVSEATKAANASGDLLVATAPPALVTRAMTSLRSRTLTAAPYNLSTTDRGAPFGKNSPYHVPVTILGKPASAMVGTSGNSGRRCGAMTASILSLPALTYWSEVDRVDSMTWT